MSVIAAIERARQCVWGYGANQVAAMNDARQQIAGKPHFKVGKLEFVAMREDADLDLDGESLWKYCILGEPEKATPLQESLF